MKIISTGQLGTAVSGSGVTGKAFNSGTSTPPIDLSGIGSNDRVGVWLSVEGDFGISGASIDMIWKGSYAKSGATYTAFLRGDQSGLTGNYVVKNARTTGGFFANGSYMKVIQPCMPWMRLEAIRKISSTTTAGVVKWAVCAF